MVYEFPFDCDKLADFVLAEIWLAILQTDTVASIVAMLKSQHSWMLLFSWRALSELATYSL